MKAGYQVTNIYKSEAENLRFQYLNKLVKVIDHTLNSDTAFPIYNNSRNFLKSNHQKESLTENQQQ